MASAQNVAAAVITEHPNLTQMELHKLLYLVQAANLAWFDEPAFEDERIEAWKYGPVVRGVAGTYKDFDERPIKEPLTGEANAVPDRLRWVIGEVLREYGDFGGPQLADLVKGPGSPWRTARGDIPTSAPSSAEIERATMADFHRHYGLSPIALTDAERGAAERFAESPDGESLADLFEEVTGVRPKVAS